MTILSEKAVQEIEEQIEAENTEEKKVTEKISGAETFNTQGAAHADSSLSGMIGKVADWWKTIRGDMLYYSGGHGAEGTHPDAKAKIGKLVSELDKFFDKEMNWRGKGVVPSAIKELEKLQDKKYGVKL